MFRKLGIFYTLCRKLGIFYTLCRKLGIFYTLRLTPEAKTRTLIGFIAKKHCEEKNLSSEKIRHTSMVNSWKIKKKLLATSVFLLATSFFREQFSVKKTKVFFMEN